MLGFNMKPEAKGVVFYQKNGKTIVRNLIPPRHFPKSLPLVHSQERMRVLGNIIKEHLYDLIYPAWNPLAKEPLSGLHLFFKVNAKRVGIKLNWGKMLLTTGPINPPRPFSASYCPTYKKNYHLETL